MKSLFPSVVNAAYVLAIQVFALVTLAPVAFGAFSIQYLLFAFASSLSLSLISEAWMRGDLNGKGRASWTEYSSASVYVAGAAGLVTLVVSLVIDPLMPVAWVGAIAVAASTYRSSARYYSVRMSSTRGALAGDIAGLLTAVTLWALWFGWGGRDLFMITTVWAAGSVASAAFSKWPRLLSPPSVVNWVRGHWSQIRVLLGDSLLSNVSSIGTPYALAPMLGLYNFGVYRAISNVAAPVRLILTPLAPQLARVSLARHRSGRRVAVMIGGSALFGLLAYVALTVIGHFDLELGALSAIVEFAVPAALFVSANFVGHYLSIVARAHLGGKRLLAGRAVHAILGIALPILGAVMAGLSGAIWGYTGSIAVASGMWMVLVLRRPR